MDAPAPSTTVAASVLPAALSTPVIEVDFPDIERWHAGNAGIDHVWRFSAAVPGPCITIQALTHGNEVCGAICADWLLTQRVRPTRGTLCIVFANVDAYRCFDRDDPYASRCLDEDFNRLWSAEVLDSARRSRELARARALRPVYDATDHLLDLHSMTDPCAPLALAGRHDKGVALARAIGIPESIVIDAGHSAGKRLRDYAAFDDPDDPRSALLVECGQHWERAAPVVARTAALRFLHHFGMLDPVLGSAHLDACPAPPQRTIEITHVVTIETDDFAFAVPVSGLGVIAEVGTLLARDGTKEIRTTYRDAVLVMPARRPRKGETAVRIGRVSD
ncbi:MAG: succinylglutamate desuccinylase/aspartoacylase family protein [Burkholderiales bacterium]|nr:succinylglutamate desuccinylase/aspartoacylase family protein [Burkholderiales bacterium]